MNQPLRVGMIGLDTSHCPAFADLLNNPDNSYHIPGGRVITAFKGGSADFAISRDRVEGFSQQLQEKYGVEIVPELEQVAERSDAILLTSVDGRVHLQQFAAIAKYGKPVFIDKPLAVSHADAKELFRIADEHRVPMFSCSSLRYADSLINAVNAKDKGDIYGFDCFGPMSLEPVLPGLFWYGIHVVEMMYTVMGTGCVQVTATTTEDHDVVTGVWRDGRIGTLRGNRKDNYQYGGFVHRAEGTEFVNVSGDSRPLYVGLLERVMNMFQTGMVPVRPEETIELVRFMEAANESRETGKTVIL